MGLVRRERELGRPYLGETASGAQLSQPQGRVCARDQDHVGIRGEVLEGVVQRSEAFVVGDGLKIVEDDHEIFAEVGDPVHQLIDRRRDRARQPGQPPQSSTAQSLTHTIDPSCDVRPQPQRIVVSSVQRHPGKRSRPTGAPRTDRSCLAVPCGRGDKCQLRVVAGVENPADVPPVKDPTALPWRRQFRFGERQLVRVNCARGASAGRGAAPHPIWIRRHHASGIYFTPRSGQSIARSIPATPTPPPSCDGTSRPRCPASQRNAPGSMVRSARSARAFPVPGPSAPQTPGRCRRR